MIRTLACIIVLAWAGDSTADIIYGPPTYPILGAGGILGAPSGQSFTATINEPQAKTVSFAWGGTFNPQLPDPTMIARLRDGVGFNGTVLATQTVFSIPDSTTKGTWIDFTFPVAVPLVAGQKYSIEFSPSSTAHTSGSIGQIANFAYADGGALKISGGEEPDIDLAFRILSAPEPSTFALIVLALAALPTRRRKSVLHNRV